MPDTPTIKILRPGDTSKADPFTIAIVANPALELGEDTDAFERDPIIMQKEKFDASADYIYSCLFGEYDGQREKFLADSSIAGKIRVLSIFITGLPAQSSNALLVGDDGLLIARRDYFVQFLSRYNLSADVAYAVSASEDYTWASAWATSDDDSRPGIEFTLDGRKYYHRYYYKIPGTVAMHEQNRSLTAIHELGHAASSYTNGYLSDIYVDFHSEDANRTVINKRWRRRGRPIPNDFCRYNDAAYSSDRERDSLGYESGWRSYHCELIDPNLPAIMDSYPDAGNGKPEQCQHDKITRRFLLDRIRAKCMR